MIIETAIGEKIEIRADQYGQAFDRATELAGIYAIDGLGDRFIYIFGDWVVLPKNETLKAVW